MKLIVRTGIVLLLWDIFIALCVAAVGDPVAAATLLVVVPVASVAAGAVLSAFYMTLGYLVPDDGPGEYDD